MIPLTEKQGDLIIKKLNSNWLEFADVPEATRNRIKELVKTNMLAKVDASIVIEDLMKATLPVGNDQEAKEKAIAIKELNQIIDSYKHVQV